MNYKRLVRLVSNGRTIVQGNARGHRACKLAGRTVCVEEETNDVVIFWGRDLANARDWPYLRVTPDNVLHFKAKQLQWSQFIPKYFRVGRIHDARYPIIRARFFSPNWQIYSGGYGDFLPNEDVQVNLATGKPVGPIRHFLGYDLKNKEYKQKRKAISDSYQKAVVAIRLLGETHPDKICRSDVSDEEAAFGPMYKAFIECLEHRFSAQSRLNFIQYQKNKAVRDLKSMYSIFHTEEQTNDGKDVG